MKLKITLLFIFSLFLSNALAQKKKYEIVVPNVNIPWGFVFLPDHSILYTEKSGKLIRFQNKEKIKIKGVPEIYLRGQGGLLDVALHPEFDKNQWIYITYASPAGSGRGGNTALMRAKLVIEENKLTNHKLLYKATPNSTRGQHFGSRIVFDNQNHIYFSIGDRGNRDVNPQDLSTDGGKIYRLHDDGTIPLDNPFINEDGAKKAIFSYGHRNPQGLEINPFTNQIWSHEHGPQGGDEINVVRKGKNYGWPKASFGINYSGTRFTDKTSIPGMEDPIHYWTPSIAPSGMAFITSDRYEKWKGSLLVGSLKFQYINRCIVKGDTILKEERLLEGVGRVRSIEQGPDGYIYVGVEQLGILKLLPQ